MVGRQEKLISSFARPDPGVRLASGGGPGPSDVSNSGLTLRAHDDGVEGSCQGCPGRLGLEGGRSGSRFVCLGIAPQELGVLALPTPEHTERLPPGPGEPGAAVPSPPPAGVAAVLLFLGLGVGRLFGFGFPARAGPVLGVRGSPAPCWDPERRRPRPL